MTRRSCFGKLIVVVCRQVVRGGDHKTNISNQIFKKTKFQKIKNKNPNFKKSKNETINNQNFKNQKAKFQNSKTKEVNNF